MKFIKHIKPKELVEGITGYYRLGARLTYSANQTRPRITLLIEDEEN